MKYIYSPALKKGGGGYKGFGLSDIQFVCLSVCLFVRSSVCHNLDSAQYFENAFIEIIQILYVH